MAISPRIFGQDSDGPLVDGQAVDISTTDHTFARSTRTLHVGGAGDVKVTMRSGATLTWSAVPAGTRLPISVTKVFKVGTTATLMLGAW